MSSDPVAFIKDADFEFENMPVKVVANRNNSQIEVPGIKVGPFTEGKEYEVRFWVAKELEKAGIARLRVDEQIDVTVLNKIHWKEARVQTSQRLASLPDKFYPKLRHYLEDLNEEAIKKPEKRSDYEKAKKLFKDINTIRLKKLVSLASSPAKTRLLTENLTEEERALYDHLYETISKWRSEILKKQGEDTT
ncbi:MAG TPA: hypothetical protein VLM82_03360 [Acidobacteriota bacterium]|nr:hypothetical protein [Acidobacteriota bacterium]